MPRVEGSIGPSAYAKRVAKRLKEAEEADSIGRTIKYLLSQATDTRPKRNDKGGR